MPRLRDIRKSQVRSLITAHITVDPISSVCRTEERTVPIGVVVEAEEPCVLLLIGNERRLVDDEPRAKLVLRKAVRRRPRRHEAGRREPQGVVRRHAVGCGQRVLRHRHRARIGVKIRHVADRPLVDPVRHGAVLVRDDARIGAVPNGDVLRARRGHGGRGAARDRHGVVARLEGAGGERERDRRA